MILSNSLAFCGCLFCLFNVLIQNRNEGLSAFLSVCLSLVNFLLCSMFTVVFSVFFFFLNKKLERAKCRQNFWWCKNDKVFLSSQQCRAWSNIDYYTTLVTFMKKQPKCALHNNHVLPHVFLMCHKLNCRIRNGSRKFCGYFKIRKFHSVGCHEQANTNTLDSSRCVYVVSSVSCKGDQYYVSEDRMQSLARINR